MRDLADPKLAFERLQAAKAAGKVQVATREPAKDGEPIVLTVTSQVKPDRTAGVGNQSQGQARGAYHVPTAASARNGTRSSCASTSITTSRSTRKSSSPRFPKDVTVIDQINRKPGLVKGDLTEDEIARKVVRAFFEALIAGDYDKAGLIYEGMPGAKLKETYGQARFLRIVEIGKPAPRRTRSMKAPPSARPGRDRDQGPTGDPGLLATCPASGRTAGPTRHYRRDLIRTISIHIDGAWAGRRRQESDLLPRSPWARRAGRCRLLPSPRDNAESRRPGAFPRRSVGTSFRKVNQNPGHVHSIVGRSGRQVETALKLA